MSLEFLERIIKNKGRKTNLRSSGEKTFSEFLAEVGEARKNGPPVLADYQIFLTLILARYGV
jgi:hypothetical protein